jgi:hypothetical protein
MYYLSDDEKDYMSEDLNLYGFSSLRYNYYSYVLCRDRSSSDGRRHSSDPPLSRTVPHGLCNHTIHATWSSCKGHRARTACTEDAAARWSPGGEHAVEDAEVLCRHRQGLVLTACLTEFRMILITLRTHGPDLTFHLFLLQSPRLLFTTFSMEYLSLFDVTHVLD